MCVCVCVRAIGGWIRVPLHAKSNPACVVALHRVVLQWLMDVQGREEGDTGAREGETQPAAKGEARGEGGPTGGGWTVGL